MNNNIRDPFKRPWDNEEEEVENQPVNDLINKLTNAPTPPEVVPDEEMVQEQAPDPRALILDELRALRGGDSEAVKEAASRDRMTDLLNNLNKSSAQVGAGLANRAGITDIKAQPIDIKSNELDQARSANKSRIESLMSEYGLLTGREKEKTDQQRAEEMMNLQKDTAALARDRFGLDKDIRQDQLGVAKDRLDLDREIRKDQLDINREKNEIDRMKAEQKAAAGENLTLREKELIKAQAKEDVKIRAENREERKIAEKSVGNIEDQLKKVDEAIKRFESHKGIMPLTGPLGYGAVRGELPGEGQVIRNLLQGLTLDVMTKMFEGMSKAIDSDAERKFFEQSQVGMTLTPETNLKVLKDMRERMTNLVEKEKNFISSIDRTGAFKYEEGEEPTQQAAPRNFGTVKVGNKEVRVGSVINANGKRFRVVDTEGNLEEVR